MSFRFACSAQFPSLCLNETDCEAFSENTWVTSETPPAHCRYEAQSITSETTELAQLKQINTLLEKMRVDNLGFYHTMDYMLSAIMFFVLIGSFLFLLFKFIKKFLHV